MNDKITLAQKLRHVAGTGDTYGVRIIREAAGLLEAETARADAIEYRHECLKSMYEDVLNYTDTGKAEKDIDDFIMGEET